MPLTVLGKNLGQAGVFNAFDLGKRRIASTLLCQRDASMLNTSDWCINLDSGANYPALEASIVNAGMAARCKCGWNRPSSPIFLRQTADL